MRIFLACSGMMLEAYQHLRERFVETGRLHELRSYIELMNFTGHTLPRFGKSFFLDSGAFSAWSQGWRVDVHEYGDFLLKYQDQIDFYANLDAIPKIDPITEERTEQSVLEAAKQTLENQKILEAKGLQPVPVFHKGEPIEYLIRYVENYDYICLGGLTLDAKSGKNESFFDELWSTYLSNPDGTPKCKVHAFGMTSLPLMRKYPWFSSDSSSWLITSKHGMICIPSRGPNGEYDFDIKPYQIAVSEKSSAREWHGWHYDTISDEVRQEIHAWLAEIDVKYEDLTDYPDGRFAVNLEYWVRVQERASFSPIYRRRQGILL